MHRSIALAILVCALVLSGSALAGVGNPQVTTEHPFYPGAGACNSFWSLQSAQAKLYQHVTGKKVTTDQDKALAAWLWRNTHYWHGEPGAEDIWGQGFGKGPDSTQREYWTGLYAFGFGLCGTTHAQWTAELQNIFGHNRARTVGTAGHNSFEVFLEGEGYGDGKWVLLDHDISTVIFDKQGKSLLSLAEIVTDWKQYATRDYAGNKDCGWLPCGLHPEDGGVYADYNTAEYFPGYAGLPPNIYLRRGETLRQYYEPGLEDGQTFVYWGRNYNIGGIPGPERSHTWVNQPEKMYLAKNGAGYKPGQARYANAVYTYTPDFASEDYREGVIDEGDGHVTFEFYTPYIIATTPAGKGAWDIYQPGGKNGLVIRGSGDVQVSISVDQGTTWQAAGKLKEVLDITDLAKGFRQYWLKFHAGAKQLADAKPTITTICQMNGSLLPRLTDGKNTIVTNVSQRGVISAGPTVAQAKAHLIAGAFDSPTATLELTSPRDKTSFLVYAAAHWKSSNPPDPQVEYFIDYSTDAGRTWEPLVRDWHITRRGNEPKDFWSQSFCYGGGKLKQDTKGPVQVRFRNSHKKQLARAEMHLVYSQHEREDGFQSTLAWTNTQGPQQQKLFGSNAGDVSSQSTMEAGEQVRMRWIETQPSFTRRP